MYDWRSSHCGGNQSVVLTARLIECVFFVLNLIFAAITATDEHHIAIKATLYTYFALGSELEFYEAIYGVIAVFSDSTPWLDYSSLCFI